MAGWFFAHVGELIVYRRKKKQAGRLSGLFLFG
jgi:hypothetical protein